MTDQYIEALYRNLFARMQAAGWIESWRLPGPQLVWLPWGAGRSVALRHWYHALALDGADFRPQLAFLLAHGTAVAPWSTIEIHAALRPYLGAGLALAAGFTPADGLKVRWTDAGLAFCRLLREIAAELRLDPGEDAALLLCQACADHAPDQDTPVLGDD